MSVRPVALVTGANRSLGLQVAKDLFEKGYSVVLGCRDVAKGRAAMTEIAKKYEDEIIGAGHKLSVIKLDLSDAKSIPAAVEEYTRYNDRLDVLVNNAAIYSDSEREATLTTNFFNTIAVTEAFIPLLAEPKAQKSSKSRIVIVSSRLGCLKSAGIKGEALALLTTEPKEMSIEKLKALGTAFSRGDANNGLSSSAYASSKALISAYGRALAAHLEKVGAPIAVHVTCPGYCKTDMTNHAGVKTIQEGAETLSWAASDESLENANGKFYGEKQEISFAVYVR